MLTSGHEGTNTDDIALQEAEQLIKKMFVLGEYRLLAEKYFINPDDIRKIMPQVFLLLNRQLISFTIALIMKPENNIRDVYIAQEGMGKCLKINMNEVKKITPEVKGKKEIITEKLHKDDAFLLCSCEVADSLDNKVLQHALSIFKEPEDLCKKIIFTSYNKLGVGNFSAAVFVERNKSVWERKKKSVTRWSVIASIIVLLAAIGLAINTFLFKPDESIIINKKKDNSSLIVNPPVIINQAPHRVFVPSAPPKTVKNSKTLPAKKTINNKNVAFMLNGSVVMITNWGAVGKDIKYINWEPNQRSKNRIYKYPDYTNIPSSVTVTFMDNSVRVFRIK
jgi:hypothetical protein